ncbi:MAG: hypothetical protein RL215_110 [Planctomycetota bacterium]
MNRVMLRLFSPEEPSSAVASATQLSEPEYAADRDIIPFESARRTTLFSSRLMPAVERARLLHENNECPDCGRSCVQPLELNDALISPRSRLPIPGTATIIGFQCEDCGCEWPLFRISRRSI